MTFFDGVMAVIGIWSYATIIFTVACKLFPKLLENEKIEMVYNFIIGKDDDEETYEIA